MNPIGGLFLLERRGKKRGRWGKGVADLGVFFKGTGNGPTGDPRPKFGVALVFQGLRHILLWEIFHTIVLPNDKILLRSYNFLGLQCKLKGLSLSFFAF